MLDDFDGRINWIDTLGFIPSNCIERVDKVDGDKTLFHGCFDWHSAVHGHWALLRMDLCGSERYHESVRKYSKRFTSNKITSVIKELRESPKFELPYGRAWLLKLVIEHEKWAERYQVKIPENWRQLGETTADSLIEYYIEDDSMRPPDILSNQYKNDCFSVVQIYDYYQHTGDQEKQATLSDHISKFFVEDIPFIDPELDNDPRAFLSPFWSWIYLLAKTQLDEKLFELVEISEISDDSLTPLLPQEIVPGRVHHLGMNWSRAWAIKCLTKRLLYKSSYVEKLVDSYHAHIKQGLSVHRKFAKDHPDIVEKEAYYAYYHWVPQFAVYAITD